MVVPLVRSAMSVERSYFPFLVYLCSKRPISDLFQIIVSLCMISVGNISSLIDFFSFVAWLFYGLTFTSLLILRYTMKQATRPYKVKLSTLCSLVDCKTVLVCYVSDYCSGQRVPFFWGVGGGGGGWYHDVSRWKKIKQQTNRNYNNNGILTK